MLSTHSSTALIKPAVNSHITSVCNQIKPDLGRIEKWVLRKAFDDEKNPYLPKVFICFILLLITRE